jgi:hypothetical protein
MKPLRAIIYAAIFVAGAIAGAVTIASVGAELARHKSNNGIQSRDSRSQVYKYSIDTNLIPKKWILISGKISRSLDSSNNQIDVDKIIQRTKKKMYVRFDSTFCECDEGCNECRGRTVYSEDQIIGIKGSCTLDWCTTYLNDTLKLLSQRLTQLCTRSYYRFNGGLLILRDRNAELVFNKAK